VLSQWTYLGIVERQAVWDTAGIARGVGRLENVVRLGLVDVVGPVAAHGEIRLQVVLAVT
jgi:hypothetical protein